MRRPPNFFVVGAMRSGTSALSGYLHAHPDAFMARGKETHFFDQHFDKGLDWYSQFFTDAADETAIGEATPTYLYDSNARERLAQTFPEAKLVATLRDPVDRAYSHYWHERAWGRENLPFAEAIAAEPDRLAAGDLHDGFHFSYVDRGRYLPQLRRLNERFPADALLVLFFEDLRDRPAETYATLCTFLGIDADYRPENLGGRVNAYVEFRSLWLRDLYKRKNILPRPLKRIAGRLNSKRAAYPALDANMRRRLAEAFEDDNAALASWLGRDLPGWTESTAKRS